MTKTIRRIGAWWKRRRIWCRFLLSLLFWGVIVISALLVYELVVCRANNRAGLLCEEWKVTDLALVFFTVGLVVVGWFTLKSADENTKNADRAYLVAGPLFGIPKKLDGETKLERWKRKKRALKGMFEGPWRMAIINFGKTAAYSTKVEWGFCPRDEFRTDIPVSTLLDAPDHANWRSIHMAGEVTIQDIFSPNADDPLHYRHIEISDEERVKYLGWVFFGRIAYKDVFKDEHFTTFSYHLIADHANSIGKSLSDDHS